MTKASRLRSDGKAAKHTLVVLAIAATARIALVAWAFGKFPPVADGEFYHRFAERLATGRGYTVEWADGTVTYAAHYPVGYPALVAVGYWLFGARIGIAMVVNAIVGTAGAVAVHRLALREASPSRALVAALLVALHPALFLYTPAIMTEGVTASLLVIAMACAPPIDSTRAIRALRLVVMGIVFGVCILVRPQTLLFVPFVAATFAPMKGWRRGAIAGLVLACALATVAPWTARNCHRMGRCALVSVNGGWNLLIGQQTDNGTWAGIDTPQPCRTVWDEAEKDACFERAARAAIAEHPWTWMKKIPRKLGITFDVFVAASWYLFRSNPAAFSNQAALTSGTIETIVARVLLAMAALGAAPWWRLRIRHKRMPLTALRIGFAVGAAIAAFTPMAWPAYLLLGVLCMMRDRHEVWSPLRMATGIILLATMITHAVFFGAGRYGLVIVPLVTLVAVLPPVRPKPHGASVPAS